MFRLFHRIIIVIPICLTLTNFAKSALAMDVYLFRGLAGVPFSEGLDVLENKLKTSGIHAETYSYAMWERIYKKIKKKNPGKIALIGHSMGAMSALFLAKKLETAGIKVAYMGLIDLPLPYQTAPKNVFWAEAYASEQFGFNLLKFDPHLTNLAVNTHVPNTTHITIDDSKYVHNAMISAIWLAESPGKKQ